MKKLNTFFFVPLFLHILITSSLFSQSPQGIPYQAVMRNADGTVMASSEAVLTFMIHDGTANGTVVYQESHSLTSNTQGLVSCVVGSGVVLQGNFSNINWGGGAKFLHVMMGTTDLGTQQMLSVPYALYAGSTNVAVSATGDTLTVGGQSVIVPGISAANPTINIPTSGLGAQVLPGNTTCANEYINVVGCNGQTSLTYDGRTYDLVEIGGQCWFEDNLATDQYRNGDAIPTGLDNASWSTTTNGAYAIYNNDPVNDSIYGKLYNWYTTVDSRGLCPTGWHVPSDCEWMYLEGSLGMTVDLQQFNINDCGMLCPTRGIDEGGKLKSTFGWVLPNISASNQSGFNGLPGGNYLENSIGIGYIGLWWSSVPYDSSTSFARELSHFQPTVDRRDYSNQFGFNVRCLKDSESAPIQGCTDGAACNFMANANQDDGSCLYQNATCDDGVANTVNDVINGSCVCAGTQLINGIYTMGNGVTDIDGNTYTSIIINGQEWMQQNLAVTKYRNGDPIPTGLSDATWQTTTSGAYAIYNNDEANNILYGKLYNWYTTIDSRGLCPSGWHVPSDAEWSSFINYLDPNADGGSNGNFAGAKMKSSTGWNSSNIGANNESGFTGLPGGYRTNFGSYSTIGSYGYWWSSTEYDSSVAWFRRMDYYYPDVDRYYSYKNYGISVRCVRD